MPTVADWSTTPASNYSAAGVNIGPGCDAGNMNDWGWAIMAQLKAAVANIPAGTVMLFAQTTAPTGWTKLTTHDNKALRVVSGTAGSGGTVDFTTAFVSQSGTTDSHTLTSAEMPAHQHFAFNGNSGSGSLSASNYATGAATGLSNASYTIQGDSTAPTIGLTSSTGTGGGHTHTFSGINLAVKYMDVIAASRDA